VMPKPSRKATAFKSSLIWAAIGLVINVLIAWALATINKPEILREEQITVSQSHWPMPAPAGWPKYKHGEVEEAEQGPHTETILWGASRAGGATFDSGRWYVMEVRTAGLPFRCLVEGWCEEYVQVGTPPPLNREHKYVLGWLPLWPLWPGFALNTLFYAALAWGLWQLPLAIRRRRRRTTGRCVACGYDLKGLAVGAACPECGLVPRVRA
jgi:hypothetical protein